MRGGAFGIVAASVLVDLLHWWLRQHEATAPADLAQAIDRIVVRPALTCW